MRKTLLILLILLGFFGECFHLEWCLREHNLIHGIAVEEVQNWGCSVSLVRFLASLYKELLNDLTSKFVETRVVEQMSFFLKEHFCNLNEYSEQVLSLFLLKLAGLRAEVTIPRQMLNCLWIVRGVHY